MVNHKRLSIPNQRLQWGDTLPHVVTSSCVNHKFQDCVAVCPVDAFREAHTYLVIDPEECIDCGACATECPVEAIYLDDNVPLNEIEWIDRNANESIDSDVANGGSPILGKLR